MSDMEHSYIHRIDARSVYRVDFRLEKLLAVNYINTLLGLFIMPIKIDYKKCCWKDGKCTSCTCGKSGKATACVGCVEACPVGALTRGKKVVLDASACIECGACVSACKHNAISMK
jgi:ferredoxin